MKRKNKIIFIMLPILLSLFLINLVNAQTSKYPQITEQSCDAIKRCPGELECYSFSGIGLRCAQPNPCSYFECPKGTQCAVAESYPGQVMCSCVGPECPATSKDTQTVSYNLLTQTVIRTINQNEQPVSRNISLWKTTPGNKGILETTFGSVEYSNELTVDESKLFMQTSVGKKLINVMPEDAVAVSETPNVNLIEKIELKEEAKSPVYFIKSKKQAKILFVLPVNLRIETKVNAETGKIISIKKPWWGFLAR